MGAARTIRPLEIFLCFFSAMARATSLISLEEIIPTAFFLSVGIIFSHLSNIQLPSVLGVLRPRPSYQTRTLQLALYRLAAALSYLS